MRKNYILILFSLGVLCIGTLIISLIWKDEISSFFDFSLLDCVNFLATMIIGVAFSYTISVSLQAETKKNTIYEESLSAASETARNIITYLENNSNKVITPEMRIHILAMFQILSADIGTYTLMCKNNNTLTNEQSELLKKRKNFNHVLTGDGLIVGKKVSEKYIYQNIKAFYDMQNCFFKCKLQLSK